VRRRWRRGNNSTSLSRSSNDRATENESISVCTIIEKEVKVVVALAAAVSLLPLLRLLFLRL